MTTAIPLLLAATLLAADGPRPALLAAGPDPARGLLVNRTPGARPFDPPAPALPSVVFVHGFNPTPGLVHFTMAQRLAEALARRGVACNVLEWDWNAATFESWRPRTNSLNAVAQGRRLAAELVRAGVDPARTHLIGHSAGGMVATSAAHEFATRWGRPVAQLTLLEAATYYHALIFEQLQAGALAPLVENYYTESPSAFGREAPLPGVRNYHVTGTAGYLGVVRPLRSDHLGLFAWYVATVNRPGAGPGCATNRWIAPSL